MKVVQLYELVNGITQEVLGNEAVVNEDLSNVVDIGKEIIDTDNVDNYVKKLVNHIGKVVFVDRLYAGGVPSVLMDSWEYGSILEKITADLPNATENDSYKLIDGKDYSPDIFYQPSVSVKFFNSKVTFEIPLSFTEIQVKESFSNVNQLNGFISMLTTSVENSMTLKLDSLIMRTINNMIAETLVSDLGSGLEGEKTVDYTSTGVRAVNLQNLYNGEYGETLTAEKAFSNPAFIRYASYVIGLYTDRMSRLSTLFNVGGKDRFTPINDLHTVLLSDFEKASNVFLKSDIAGDSNLVSLPKHETVPYWQGSGLTYSFEDVSKVDVKTSTSETVSTSGIVGVMFDRNAIGVSNLDKRVTSNYNPKAEFYTNFYKFESGYFNDLNENFVVFFIA